MSYLDMSREELEDHVAHGGLDDDMFFSLHEEAVNELGKAEATYNAVIDYMLGDGYCEDPLDFLRAWNEGDFEGLRKWWPNAPKEIYFTDPLYKGE